MKPKTRRKSAEKSANNTPKASMPALVPQPNGKGALLSGGIPGNRGNPDAPGRPPGLIRQRLRGSFDERIAILEEIADGLIDAPPKERIRAIDILAKYGLGEKTEVEVTNHPEVQRFVSAHAQATIEIAGEQAYQKIAARVKELAA